MQTITSLIRADREYRSVLDAVSEQQHNPHPLPLVVNGLAGGARTAFLSACVQDMHRMSGAPVLIVVPSEDDALRLCDLLRREGTDALYYPRRELIFHNMSASHDTDRERLSVLSALCRGEAQTLVTTGAAALSRTMPREKLDAMTLTLRAGDTTDPCQLRNRLCELGFLAVDAVESAGQFAHRGGIFDFFCEGEQAPVRVELFGDEIDRMAYFDPDTQRVIAPCEQARILPAQEVLPDAPARALLRQQAQELLTHAKEEETRQRLTLECEALRAQTPLPSRDKYLPLIYPDSCLLSYLEPACGGVILCNSAAVYEDIRKQYENLNEKRASLQQRGLIPRTMAPYAPDRAVFDDFAGRHVSLILDPFAGAGTRGPVGGLFGLRTRRTVAYGDNASMLAEDLRALRKSMYRVLLICESKSGGQSLLDVLREADIPATPVWDQPDFDYLSMQNGCVYLTVGQIDEGFDLLMPKVAVLSMQKDSGRAVMAHRRQARMLRRVGGAGEKLLSYADLRPGDYVVHEHCGIGQFEGIETVTVQGITRDYIVLRYADEDKLYVPCDRLEVIGKYIGPTAKDGEVRLSHMGGADWQRTKGRAKAAVKDIAEDLIRIYAARERLPGFAFAPDSQMEREFDEKFAYELTDCQRAAVEDVKRDMEKPVPMNRLLCGDVGYGKTEVALRAAFKAIVGGKQVALLVPTTILALQHYQTALSRMRGYAVNVEMLSRLRTPKEQQQILRRLARGDIDLLIGTHKILSKKLQFCDLGLLIVDEEQRFGVAQKERLRDIGQNVDTLTLTATPIPRTLNMAMQGIADLSVLDEAPMDRRPVQTYVTEYDELLLQDAMRRELDRGGQVLYLSNRVDNIDLVAGRIMRALPDARVASAHGQMEKEDLEDIWQSLVRGEIDILVCTTIIETGVDLPNANTLIIEDADRMGLSQLHQLRGRVGRSTRQAYAYFTYRPGKALTEVAEKRLQTIREFAEFGAGFRIALRDLEIRGAGNLLGAQQHGCMDGVGYELYMRLLSEAVLEEQGKKILPAFESTVDLQVSAHLPATYIPSSAGRMQMYKKISLIRDRQDKEDVLDEMIDRYGDPPVPAQKLLDISLIRALAQAARVSRVEKRGNSISLTTEKPDLALWSEVFAAESGLSMRGGAILAALRGKEDALSRALAVLCAYDRAYKNSEGEPSPPCAAVARQKKTSSEKGGSAS